MGQLDKCSFYEQKSAEDYRVHVLPADGENKGYTVPAYSMLCHTVSNILFNCF